MADRLAAHLRHDYPDYEVVFAVADVADPAVAVIQRVMAEHPHRRAQLVVAPRLPDCVEKLSNQLAALAATDPRSEVFAFADSDGMPRDTHWLRALVGGLHNADATTGYRWHLPPAGGRVAGTVHSAFDTTWLVYHVSGGTVWAGAMALTRATFAKLDVAKHWACAITDDLALMRCVAAVRGRVRFMPGAMVATDAHARFRGFWEWGGAAVGNHPLRPAARLGTRCRGVGSVRGVRGAHGAVIRVARPGTRLLVAGRCGGRVSASDALACGRSRPAAAAVITGF